MTLKVKPDALIAKSGELSNEKSTVMALMDQAKSEINSLTGVFKGEAADELQVRFKQIYDDIDNILAIVSEYISDLNDVASIYTAAGAAALGASEGLPTEGVFR